MKYNNDLKIIITKINTNVRIYTNNCADQYNKRN